MVSYSLSDKELEFLGTHVGLQDVVFEWGSGLSTAFLATRCKRLTTVEHQPTRAAEIALGLYNAGKTNVAVYCVPPDLPYQEGGEDDGDLATFHSYVTAYTGQGVDVVLSDGRARVETIRWAVERAPFGPTPAMRWFVHDVDREALAPIFKGPERLLEPVEFVERLALLKMRER